MKKIGALGIVAILALLGVVVVAASAYTVAEYEQVIVTQFGKPIGGPVTEAGLHWRKPFIQTVHRFEKRLLEHDGEKTEIPTKDKKFIEIDTFARWRIVDPLLFFQSVRDEYGARMKLDDIIDSETRDAISSNYLIEAVRNTNRTLKRDAEIVAASTTVDVLPIKDEESPSDDPTDIERGRSEITKDILERSRSKVKEYGIGLVDVQIKSINYVSRVQERVFERMVSEREQIAAKYRAEGQKIFAEMQGKIEKERNRILSEAYRTAETIKGEAEAEATKVYADAYGKDPEFYKFWRTLEIYREQLGENVSLVIGTDSGLFRFLKGSQGTSPGS